MGKIFCIMGKSATGKDTIYKKMLEETSFDWKRMIPYTTRPIRDGEVRPSPIMATFIFRAQQ